MNLLTDDEIKEIVTRRVGYIPTVESVVASAKEVQSELIARNPENNLQGEVMTYTHEQAEKAVELLKKTNSLLKMSPQTSQIYFLNSQDYNSIKEAHQFLASLEDPLESEEFYSAAFNPGCYDIQRREELKKWIRVNAQKIADLEKK